MDVTPLWQSPSLPRNVVYRLCVRSLATWLLQTPRPRPLCSASSPACWTCATFDCSRCGCVWTMQTLIWCVRNWFGTCKERAGLVPLPASVGVFGQCRNQFDIALCILWNPAANRCSTHVVNAGTSSSLKYDALRWCLAALSLRSRAITKPWMCAHAFEHMSTMQALWIDPSVSARSNQDYSSVQHAISNHVPLHLNPCHRSASHVCALRVACP